MTKRQITKRQAEIYRKISADIRNGERERDLERWERVIYFNKKNFLPITDQMKAYVKNLSEGYIHIKGITNNRPLKELEKKGCIEVRVLSYSGINFYFAKITA